MCLIMKFIRNTCHKWNTYHKRNVTIRKTWFPKYNCYKEIISKYLSWERRLYVSNCKVISHVKRRSLFRFSLSPTSVSFVECCFGISFLILLKTINLLEVIITKILNNLFNLVQINCNLLQFQLLNMKTLSINFYLIITRPT